MATAKKRKPTAKKTAQTKQNDSQFWSVILFALGVLMLCFIIVKGETDTLWCDIHTVIFGLFGVSAVIAPAIVIYAAVMMAMDKSSKAVAGKLIQGVVLILLVSAAIQIFFVGTVNGAAFGEKVKLLYEDGTQLRGGGAASFILGLPLLSLFKKTGAAIIICILLFVFVMLMTNISLLDFLGIFYKPFKKIGSAMKQAREEDIRLPKPEKTETDNSRKKTKVPPNIDVPEEARQKPKLKNIDIPLPDKAKTEPAEPEQKTEEQMPQHPVEAPKKLDEKISQANKEIDTLIKKAADEIKEEVKEKEEKTEKPTVSAAEPETVAADEIQTEVEKNEQEMLCEPLGYKLPPTSLLSVPSVPATGESTAAEMKQRAETLVNTLKSFGVQTRIVDIHRGPTVTRYELQPSAGVKISKITGLADDIALNLAAQGVRIEAPIPGKAAVGIEIPNKEKDGVSIRELLESPAFTTQKSKIAFALGKDIEGNIIVGDIGKMPHMIIAGTTGSGKSVCTNSIIMSILFNATPDEVRLVLIDPKMVEFSAYEGIPHLLIPVVTDPRKAAGALNWAVMEMEKRYKLFADNHVRDLNSYNVMAISDENEEVKPLPQIVIVIDEFADLMMTASKEVEDAVCRLAQKARAAGMHLIIATQRPTVDVITGLIKANIPSRIALTVSSQIDSRTIIDTAGAEKLLGYGDMLYYPQGIPKPVRIQGCFCSEKEVLSVVDFIKNEVKADYDASIIEEIEKNTPQPKGEKRDDDDSSSAEPQDEMLEKAIEIVVETGQASTSYLQRRLKLGYARAARIVDELENIGVVGPSNGAKPRDVLMTRDMWLERKMRKDAQNTNSQSE